MRGSRGGLSISHPPHSASLIAHTRLTFVFLQSGARGRQLRFLANVDPVDVARSLNGLDPETTLVVVVSKTFTTAETMLNARTVRQWIIASLGKEAVAKHMVAVSTNLKLVSEFGIDPDNAFAFWDWVGGRYSVCSAVGMLPLSLQYGYETMETFLQGAWNIDEHFATAPFEENLPVTLGMLSLWNVSFLECPARAILPYTQALAKLAPHIQQVAMESNGKGVSIDGQKLDFETGEIDFGEPVSVGGLSHCLLPLSDWLRALLVTLATVQIHPKCTVCPYSTPKTRDD